MGVRKQIALGSIWLQALTGLTATGGDATGRDDEVARAFLTTTRSTVWTQTAKIPLRFATHHPQGFTLVGDLVFLSSVEVIEPPVRYPEPIGGYDRSPGKGVGHLFVLDRQGNLKADIEVGEDTVYHPGGIDFDGKSVWIPVAEYRPNSKAIVYRVDPVSLRVTEVFRHRDHVGGITRDRRTGRLHGVSWGSRTFFEWSDRGRLARAAANPSHLVDYQDCGYVARGKQLCGGVTGLPTAGGTSYELGGLALLDLTDGNRILHEIPFPGSPLPVTSPPATRSPWRSPTADSASSPPPTTARKPPAPNSSSTRPRWRGDLPPRSILVDMADSDGHDLLGRVSDPPHIQIAAALERSGREYDAMPVRDRRAADELLGYT